MYFYGVIIPILSFVLQVWPRLKNRYFGIDTWRHLLLADYVRKHHKIPEILEEHYIQSSGNPGYPPMIYLILSIFPKKFTERYQFIFAPIFDALQNFLIFIFAYSITHNIMTAVSAQVIAMLTPIAVIEASNLSTRTLSYLFFTLSFLPLILFSATHIYIWLFISFVMLAVLFLTHKFGIQAYFISCLGFSILEITPFYILFFLITFSFMYLCLGKIYRPILREHLLILGFWKNHISNRFVHQFRGEEKPAQIKDFVNRAYLIAFKNPYIYLLASNPWIAMLLSLLVLLYFRSLYVISTVTNSVILVKLEIWVLVLITAGIVMLSVKPLRFLGEGNRYLEYCILPISLVLASYFPSLVNTYRTQFIIPIIFFLVALLIYIIFIQTKVVLNDKMRSITPAMWECIKFLNKFGTKARVAIFPLQLGDALTYFIRGKILTTYNNEGLANIQDIYPTLKLPLNKLVKKYDLNFILFYEGYVTLEELKLEKNKVEINKDGFILLRV